MLRPPAGSLPLGFFAFGTGSVLLSAERPHRVPTARTASLMLLILVFVAPLTARRLVWDGGAACALGVLGATWAGTALVTLPGPPGGRAPALVVLVPTAAPLMLLLFRATRPCGTPRVSPRASDTPASHRA
nr:hypothetical protein [Streptomyces incarnatus]